jgi:hypothetical protein
LIAIFVGVLLLVLTFGPGGLAWVALGRVGGGRPAAEGAAEDQEIEARFDELERTLGGLAALVERLRLAKFTAQVRAELNEKKAAGAADPAGRRQAEGAAATARALEQRLAALQEAAEERSAAGRRALCGAREKARLLRLAREQAQADRAAALGAGDLAREQRRSLAAFVARTEAELHALLPP